MIAEKNRAEAGPIRSQCVRKRLVCRYRLSPIKSEASPQFAEIYRVCFLFLYHEVAKEGREGGRGEKKIFSESLERRKDRSMK